MTDLTPDMTPALVEREHARAEAAEARVAELEKGIPLREIENASHAELVRLCGAEASFRKQIEGRLQQATELVEELLRSAWLTPSGAEKARAFLAALAGEDDD